MSSVSPAGLVSPIDHIVSKLCEFQPETNVETEELVLALCFFTACAYIRIVLEIGTVNF